MRLLINIDVPDLVQAERFYCAAFGLRNARRFGDDVIELLGAEVPIYLLRKPAHSIAAGKTQRDYTRHWTPVHCDVLVGNLDVALADALTAGARQDGAIRVADWGRIVQLADPFGHGWCLIQFSATGYNAIAT